MPATNALKTGFSLLDFGQDDSSSKPELSQLEGLRHLRNVILLYCEGVPRNLYAEA
jgi:hypothetical protein